MPRPRLVRPRLVAAALAVLFLLPATASAAGGLDITGTVTRDGVPVENAGVLAWIDGSDMVVPATTDLNGAFAVQVEGDIGSVLQVRATGATVTLPPDEQGCVRSETPTGSASITIEAVPVPPVAISLDRLLVSRVCGATATPGSRVTPPSTDAVVGGAGPHNASTGSVLGLLGLLGLVVAVAVRPVRRR